MVALGVQPVQPSALQQRDLLLQGADSPALTARAEPEEGEAEAEEYEKAQTALGR